MAAATPAEEDRAGRALDARLARRLLGWMRPHWGVAVAALGCLAVGAAMQLAVPLLTRWVIDTALPARDTGALRTAVLLFGTLLLGQFAAAYGETVLTARLGQRVMRDLRGALFAHLQRLPIATLDRTPVGRLVTRVTSDVEALNELFTSGVVAGVGDLATLVAIGAVMLGVDWRLALAAFAVIPAVAAVSGVFQARVRRAYREIRLRVARLNAYLGERLAGMRLVQLFGEEPRERATYAALNDAHQAAQLRSITLYALYFPVIEVLTALALASLLVAGGARVEAGGVTVGTVAAFLQLVRRFFQPLQDLAEKANILQAAMAAAERIVALLDEPLVPGGEITPDRAAQVAALRRAGVTVTFEEVWFAYPAAQGMAEEVADPQVSGAVAHTSAAGAPAAPPWALRGVSFTVRPGETVALVGPTGAGKSTVVGLLLRYHAPQRGRILVNGRDIATLPLDVLRSLIGYVPQELFLFAGDALENVRLGSALDAEAVQAAAARVGADRVIARLPGGWAQPLGERGATLSMGERQLLALARAVAADPALLVLDEATSAVDSAAEAAIQAGIASLMAGRTTLAIAHRLSTIAHAQEILVLHHGQVVERGPHAVLMAAGGLYARLVRLEAAAGVALPTGATPG
jgi:ATP-binding cassette subfamily B multidrug efflux pump